MSTSSTAGIKSAIRIRVSLGLLLVPFGLLGCGSEPPKADVLFITVDTLRADRIGTYGSTTARTPSIDQLAQEGTWFARAVAPLPETRPSHGTLFTSQYPRDHGVVSNTQALGIEPTTLAEVYQRAGYRTAAFVGTILLDRDSGLGRGFDHLSAGTEPQRTAQEVIDEVETYLADQSPETPLFLWVHLFDPHMPYEPQGGVRGADPEWDRQLPSFTWPKLLSLAATNEGDLPLGAVRRGRELYAGEVEVVDAAVARLRRAMQQRERQPNPLTVLTADHGECFERGIYFDHSYCLGEGALAVPLILAGPGVPRGKRSDVTEHLDLGPTLLELSDLKVPDGFGGRDLFAAEEGSSRAFFQHPIYPQSQIENRRDVLNRFRSAGGEETQALMGDRLQVGLREGDLKYLRVGDLERLYDLSLDPGATIDLSSDQPETLRRLRRKTREWLRDHPLSEAASTEMNPELRTRLEALGYL